ncbi:UDP-3-O-(R-3-hydroxymyristoyl)-glucosamine N-acyltransferase [Erythrobacter litoralis]|uniref:UDP-3-O-(R-3-hydroxymyristoyl)-glucosamine N-acyltransferase n=1 Tax=Erythrobacter litoralis (strain HTCC2594) TaxID=314225 RepID=Q2N6E2_ERYLH|nr:UDP-3-O-(R-3-hydroxymyristoyl)-glucosamine N-acyltransferase [Erythrobacter litoralis]ABC64749.1 UDP-3-O-(R-3-hydroxymyristoyl)-glucosamine N-acyltransferase [Erythrobacter litoralis HTCC2594]
MTWRLSDFAGIAGLRVERDGSFETTGKLSTPLDGLCVPLRSAQYAVGVSKNPRIAAVITKPEIVERLGEHVAVAVADDPDAAHSEIHARLAENHAQELRSVPNEIDSSARIDPSAHIADHGVTIGPNAWIGPHCAITPGVNVGEGCVLHSGTALGVPGFNTGIIGGRLKIVPQMGGVRLGPHVEMLANCTVARGIFGGHTSLGEETVADNLVYIAHDVQIGRRVQICALVNVLGRTIVGDEAYLGPSCVVKNGLVLGARARVNIGAVVTTDLAEDAIVSGNFAVPHDRFLDHIRSIR